ncbi:MAG: hypothetical protein JW839_22325 [Candidatus Lokiarchaeota archaeon]|nr:hypothetical protein [Candidatus Lokiarchaeota archaeon]
MLPDAFYKEFVSKVAAFKNDEELPRQVQYHEMIKGLYDEIVQFGPSFFSGDKVTSLIDGEERPVSTFL